MKNVTLIFGILFYSCITSKKVDMKNSVNNDLIIGRWCSSLNTADYPHLTFRQDGYAIFDCKIDTVFGLKYKIEGSHLLFISATKSIDRNKILELTQDSMILETLLELETKQVYYRCK